MARYGGSLAWQHRIPVESVLVMLRPDRSPAEIPEVGHYDIGVTHHASVQGHTHMGDRSRAGAGDE